MLALSAQHYNMLLLPDYRSAKNATAFGSKKRVRVAVDHRRHSSSNFPIHRPVFGLYSLKDGLLTLPPLDSDQLSVSSSLNDHCVLVRHENVRLRPNGQKI